MIAYVWQTLFKMILFPNVEDIPRRPQTITNENHRLVQEFDSLFGEAQ